MKNYFKKMRASMKRRTKILLLSACMVVAAAFPAFAEGGTVVTATDWSAILTSMTAQISVSTVVAAVATFITAGIGLVFMWWGVRKLVRTVMSAFRRGKLSV